jgi:hypothetical protein
MLRLLPLNSEADLARELEVVGAEVVVAEVVGERNWNPGGRREHYRTVVSGVGSPLSRGKSKPL